MKRPGKTSSHQETRIGLITWAPSAIREPRLAEGGCTPRPRKLRNDSCRITAGMLKVR